jgi:hypothetical protein
VPVQVTLAIPKGREEGGGEGREKNKIKKIKLR